MAGLTAARELVGRGYDVVVVERGGKAVEEGAAAASTTLACVDHDGKIRELPDWLAVMVHVPAVAAACVVDTDVTTIKVVVAAAAAMVRRPLITIPLWQHRTQMSWVQGPCRQES